MLFYMNCLSDNPTSIINQAEERKQNFNMDVNLSCDIVLGLKRLGNAALLNDDVFSKLVNAGICTLTDGPAVVNVNDLCSSKGDVVKDAYSALLTLLVEASRNATSADALLDGLSSNYGWPSSRAEHLSKIYKINQSKLTLALSNICSQPLHVTDVSWRLDYCIQTSAVNSLSTPLYFIKFVTEGRDSKCESNNVKFVCTLHELQDLVSRLKDALRHVERIASTSS